MFSTATQKLWGGLIRVLGFVSNSVQILGVFNLDFWPGLDFTPFLQFEIVRMEDIIDLIQVSFDSHDVKRRNAARGRWVEVT